MSRRTGSSRTEFDAAIKLASALAGRGRYLEAVSQLDACLAALPMREREARAQVLALLAHQHPRLGNLQASVRCASEAVALCQRLDKPSVLADALISLAYVYAQLLMGRDALDAALQALHTARQTQDRVQEAWALNRLGVAYSSLDNVAQARESTQQAIEIAQTLGDSELSFSCLNNLAYYALMAEVEARRNGDVDALTEALQQSMSLSQQALAEARESGSEFRIAVAASNVCDALLRGGEAATAAPLIDEYQAICLRQGYMALGMQAMAQRALLLKADGDSRAAIAALQALLRDAAERLPPKLRRIVIRALYETCKAAGDFEQALAYLEQHADLERQITRDTMSSQTEVILIRQEVEQAHARAEHALIDARRLRERARLLEREQEQLRHQAAEWGRAAHEDVLTGLHNRRHAEFALPLLLERARQEGKTISLALLDVDHFKQVNDQFGHGVGDDVLRELAQLLRGNTRSADLLARVGGEEFMMVLVGTPPARALEICERLRLAVEQHDWALLHPGLQVTVSLGLSGGEPPEQLKLLVERADHALYAAKRSGRNRVEAL
ncbi:GGDEF domain-containing protein [Paucibacter sp. APW11]|uniref:diguanylate cyclase n=1 Tax=Roseateles aquae TaxID=3077235 RepID=A0ABU3PGR1_9BURK|nr:GGDEF domain-containing protein [Paucibacter sp. APW11]MDT9001542.1 GGDEF domain-containing protein [Paucibacter sp. APW11]